MLRLPIRPTRLRTLAAATALALLPLGVTFATATAAPAAQHVPPSRPQGPCDIYAAGGTPCVAAHSTTRALYASYNGPLYQVMRLSDNAVKDIGVVQPHAFRSPDPGGYADAAAQDAFCANTTCVITKIYDQSPNHNDLTQAPRGAFSGPAMGGYDNLPIADMAPITISGHKAYGVFIEPGMGLRNNDTSGIAVDDQPEGMYWVIDGHALQRRLLLRLRQRRDRQPRRWQRHHGNLLLRQRHRLVSRQPARPVDHDRPGEQPGGLRQPGQHLEALHGPAEHHLAVRDRRGQGPAAPVGLTRRRRADGHPVDHVRRAARRLQL